MTYTDDVRPALQLDLSKVTFDSTSKTFSMSTVNVTDVMMNPSTVQTIDVGGSVALTASIDPSNATDKTVVWSIEGANAGAVALYEDEACEVPVTLGEATDKLTVYARGVSGGTVTVTAAASDGGKSASCGVTVNAAEPELKRLSLTLSGTIGANYFMDLSMLDDATREASHMEFAVGTGDKQTSCTVPFDAGKTSEEGGYFGFTCPTTSVQMAEPIQATFCYGDGVRVTLSEHSVEEYVKLIVAEPGIYGDKAVALVKSIADYGHYAQPFLAAANGWAVGVDYAEMGTFYTEPYDEALGGIEGALAGFKAEKDFGAPRWAPPPCACTSTPAPPWRRRSGPPRAVPSRLTPPPKSRRRSTAPPSPRWSCSATGASPCAWTASPPTCWARPSP